MFELKILNMIKKLKNFLKVTFKVKFFILFNFDEFEASMEKNSAQSDHESILSKNE